MFLFTDCKRKKMCFVKCSCVVNYYLRKCHFDLWIDEGMVLKWILGNKVWGGWPDLFIRLRVNCWLLWMWKKPLGLIKGRELFDYLSCHQLLKKDSSIMGLVGLSSLKDKELFAQLSGLQHLKEVAAPWGWSISIGYVVPMWSNFALQNWIAYRSANTFEVQLFALHSYI